MVMLLNNRLYDRNLGENLIILMIVFDYVSEG